MEKYFFIGIGGISMSGIAITIHTMGHEVSGSDRSESDTTRMLEKDGIKVCIGQRYENITDDVTTVVYSAAIHEDNPEMMHARELEKAGTCRVISRAVILGELLSAYQVPIGVAGSHGKTSTSSILAHIYMAAGRDPSFNIGGILHNTGTNYRVGKGDCMIIEACEYTDSFLHFHAKYNVITNIEPEHLDYFKTFEREQHSFQEYAAGMIEGGALITSPECAPLFRNMLQNRDIRIITVSLDDPSADCKVSSIEHHREGLGYRFSLDYQGKALGPFDIYLPGMHMVFDAACAALLSYEEGVDPAYIAEGIAAYRSTKKRFEYLGSYHGAMVIDDYAHHPTEIRAQLIAAREVPHKELYLVFQPHTYSRTIAFYDDFVKALSLADHIYLCDIYAAREKDTGEVSSAMLAASLKEAGADAVYVPLFEDIQKILEKKISTGDMLITMGAGNAVDIAHALLQTAGTEE